MPYEWAVLAEHTEEYVESTVSIEEAYREHVQHISNVSRRILGPCADAEDLVQDVFLEAAKSIHRLRSTAALRSWLVTLTVRMAWKRIRKRKLLQMVSFENRETYYETKDLKIGPEQQSELLRLYRHLDALPAAERVAWVLRYVEGYKLEDVATYCSCSLATAKRRISSAHTKIQAAMGVEK